MNTFGITLSYAVLIQSNLVSTFAFIRSLWWQDMPEILDYEDSVFWVIFFGVTASHQVILVPLVIKRQLKSLTIYSFLGFLTVVYLMVITISYTFKYTTSRFLDDFDDIKVFDLSGTFNTLPTFIFSFTTQINLLQCYEELEKPTLRRIHKVLAKQHFICFAIYLLIGVFGYLSFPVDDPLFDNYIQRYDPTTHIPILIVRQALIQAVVLMILVIYVAQPFNSLPCRESLEFFLCGSNKRPSSTFVHILTALGRTCLKQGCTYWLLPVPAIA